MDTSVPRPSDRFIPWYIVGFFVAFMLLLSWFAWVAVKGYTGEVTKDAYKKGLAYNRVIAKAEEQEALGWKGALQVVALGREARVTFTLKDKQDQPVKDGIVNLRCYRPTQASNDAELTLKPDGTGQYTGDVTLAWPGLWEMHVSALAGGHEFQLAKNVVLQ
jgi:nitrogen fixation protein FixH